MNLIRPEARAVLWRWREALFGAALLVASVTWAGSSFGFFRWFAVLLAVGAALLVLAGLQRGRFRGQGGGRGVVQVDERQVTYFGPLSGGTIALSDLGAVSLDKRSKPAHWLLVPGEGAPLSIPIDAEGTDALFDAFSGVSGLSTQRMLQALNSDGSDRIVIWRREDVQARALALH